MRKLEKKEIIIIGVIAVLAIVLIFVFVNANRKPANINVTVNNNIEGDTPIEDNNQNTNQMPEQQLKIEILAQGTGVGAERGDKLTVNYLGTLENGHKFDSSYDRGQPYQFQLGVGQVIDGWDEGLLGMKVGEKRKLTIPPEMGYGARAMNLIPANSTLIFTVELLKIN
ncbi:MAG: FKBP-type peptidyl-prolyl cis-trans isomerase [Candidatus Paceibacterota bacterium]